MIDMAFDFQRGGPVTYDTEGGRGQAGYPVALDLSGANWPVGVKAGGADFRLFTDSSLATPLPYAILRGEWDDDDELARVWVLRDVPDADLDTLFAAWGNPALEDASDPAAVFTFWEGFANTATAVAAAGTDSGHTSGFDPVSRRVYTFGFDDGNGVWLNIVQWRNIDTGEVGFVFPGMNTLVNTPGLVYNPATKLFYFYGGRITVSSFSTAIQTFNPATGAFTTLAATIPTAMHAVAVAYDPVSGDHFGFGGRTSSAPTFTDMIWRHNVSAGTIADTGANLPVAMMEIAAIYVTENQRIYLAGGGNQTISQTRIDVYDPATPASDPVPSAVVLSEPKDSMAAAHVERNGASSIRFFGGYNWATSGYTAAIEKLTVAGGSETIATLAATLVKADDDAIAFDDPLTQVVQTGPWLHDDAEQNEAQRKIVWHTFDPATDLLSAEPDLPGVPTGWSSVGNDTLPVNPYAADPRAIAGDTMVLADISGTFFVRAQKSLAAQTGVFVIEFQCSIPFTAASANNYQFHLRDSGQPDSDVVIHLRTNQTAGWRIWNGSTYTAIAAIPNGSWHWVGALIDRTAEQAWGYVDRANKTGPVWGATGRTLNEIWLNSSGAGREHFLVRNLLIRRSTTGTEPVASLGQQVELAGRVLGDFRTKPAVSGRVHVRPFAA